MHNVNKRTSQKDSTWVNLNLSMCRTERAQIAADVGRLVCLLKAISRTRRAEIREPGGSRGSLAQHTQNLRHSPARSGLAFGLGLALLLAGTHAEANLLVNGNFNTPMPRAGPSGWTTWSSPEGSLTRVSRQTDGNSLDGTA